MGMVFSFNLLNLNTTVIDGNGFFITIKSINGMVDGNGIISSLGLCATNMNT